MARHALSVLAPQGHVGTLIFESTEDRYEFGYDPDWLASPRPFPLSPHIPLGGQPAASGVIARFLQNLLPEGRALDVASAFHQISKNNIFGLVNLLGREPVGALSFVSDEAEPEQDVTQAPRRPISDEELSNRIRERDRVPFPVWDGRVRLSVAGFQDKLQVLLDGDRINLAEAPLASTHILKPEAHNPATPFMVANEHFCMTLASRMGLPTASVRIRRIPDPILLIERFDRKIELAEDGQLVAAVNRLHVIDACQALDMPVALKYERNMGSTEHVRHIRDGVSFAKLFTLAKSFENPATTRMFFLRWAILQLLIGNSDAHGKNLSFFLNDAGLSPAKLYDLVCVHAYGQAIEQEMAMGYGDEFHCESVTPYDLADFAHRTGMRATLVAREVTLMARQALELAPDLAKSEVYTDAERAMVHQIAQFVIGQAGRLLKIAPAVPKVDPDLL
ncbi:toxin HipA [Bordetella genomosp. 8]|uniref:Toxin HipA n=1 Tax=Bordetella genomosp. 8 TaxID=1416806 RepID=A0A1W6YGQ6_9BORD|nr:HipA domain-containing protein [Bordetella genomosp. 8]ARP80184.1 toxin HipA [Bordetella genomosp. 8]